MVKCTFSGLEIPRGTGITVASKDGKLLHFLNRKCETYYKMGRKGRNYKWTAFYQRQTKKDASKETKAPAKKEAPAAKPAAKEE